MQGDEAFTIPGINEAMQTSSDRNLKINRTGE